MSTVLAALVVVGAVCAILAVEVALAALAAAVLS
jgi:hypothetical protein